MINNILSDQLKKKRPNTNIKVTVPVDRDDRGFYRDQKRHIKTWMDGFKFYQTLGLTTCDERERERGGKGRDLMNLLFVLP